MADLCCPLEDRIDAITREGAAVADLHHHKGLLRGVLALSGRDKVMFWLVSGRLSKGVRSEMDLGRLA